MKTQKLLIVVRHGHAIEGQDDFARTLSTRGFDEVRSTGKRLQSRRTRVDHIVTSSAPRAAATAHQLAPFCEFTGSIEQVRELYLAASRVLLDHVCRTDDSIQTLMLVGHNPGLSTFVELLTGERTELGTADVRWLSLDVDAWASVTSGVGRESSA